MSSISNLYNIGSLGLFAYQEALNVTAQNMANVGTEGYSRQEAVLGETLPLNGRAGQIGTGVEVTEIKRHVDEFINAQLLSSHQRVGEFEASNSALSDIERLFNDSQNQSLGSALNDFFNALQDVATNPADLTARSVALAKAQSLTDRFHQADTALTEQRQSIDRDVGQTITKINGLASQIADLNDKISQAELSGQHANDLRDQRQRLLNGLGDLIDVSSLEDTTGQLTIFVGRGQILVDKTTAHTLSGAANAANSGLLDVQYDQVGGPVTISSIIGGGRLKGLLDVRDQTIPAVTGKLDTLASNLVSEANQQHRLGYGLDGSTGLDFFSSGGTTARTIAVNLTDGRQIAAADNAGGVPGNNVNALALVALQNKSISALGSATMGQYYAVTASGIGASAQQAANNLDAQQLIQQQLQAHWAETSGVSLDEELVNMMKYQRAFQATSKIITMTDELMQTILTLKR